MLNIHRDLKARLIERLANEINHIQIAKGGFLKFDTFLELFNIDKSLTRELKSSLVNYIGENPLYEFCYDAINNIVSQQEEPDENTHSYPLTEVPFFQNAQEASEHIINDFISLPKKYTAIFKFNKEFSVSLEVFSPRTLRDHDEYLRAEDIKLTAPTPELRATFPKFRGMAYLLQGNFDWQDENIYLVINLEGFIPKFSSTTPLHDCKSSLKAFIGLALACGIVKRGVESGLLYPMGGGYKHHEYICIFSQNGGEWAFYRSLELDEKLSELLQHLQIGYIAGSNIEEHKKLGFFLGRLRLIEAALQAKENARKIRLSAEWLCDSYTNEDDLSSFVQATTALEILLGGSKEESEKVGLTELLANRLAYLIARRPSDREDIMKHFRNIYDVRSKIVHTGKIRLNVEERAMLYSLKEMVGRALVSELALLMKEVTCLKKLKLFGLGQIIKGEVPGIIIWIWQISDAYSHDSP
jgi:hypothetical protein